MLELILCRKKFVLCKYISLKVESQIQGKRVLAFSAAGSKLIDGHDGRHRVI